jgi:uncharacterized protein (TIGR02145 family)
MSYSSTTHYKWITTAKAIATITLMFLFSCEEKDISLPPKVVTASIDHISATTAQVGGNVTNDGGAGVTERGVYWGTSSDPETTGTKLVIGNGMGIFYETLTSLDPGVKYYVKAFATNIKGTTYGNETFFTTVISLPQVVTANPEPLSDTSVSVGGEVTSDGGFEVTERGVFWSTSPNSHNTGKKEVLGNGIGVFSTTLNNLVQGATYYTRAYAKNIKGMAYGNEVSFTTTMVEPSVQTLHTQDISTNFATINGEIISTGGSTITSKGFYISSQTDAHINGTRINVDGDEETFLAVVENLLPGQMYYYTTFATNSVGTGYGVELSFTTLGNVPDAVTDGFDELRTNSVTLRGLVNANRLSTIVQFEYGTSNSYGSSINADQSPVSDNDVEVTAVITGLLPNTTYHFRVVAQNELGTSYGKDTTFTTVITGITGSVSDVDGNTYSTIGIGYQYWTTSNLRVTKLNDGTSIELAEKDSLWRTLATPGYSWYGNDSLFAANNVYGALYNWPTITSGKLCPTGWRVPSTNDVAKLMDYLGSSSVAGGLLKTTGTSQWQSPNAEATNEVGFNARPAGKRDYDGLFDFIGLEANWWTTTDYSTHTASYFYVQYNYGNAYQAYINKRTGLSVRCVKD